MTRETLVRVTAPGLSAGLILNDGVCVRAAPALRWALGYSAAYISRYFKAMGYTATQRPVDLGELVSLGGEGSEGEE